MIRLAISKRQPLVSNSITVPKSRSSLVTFSRRTVRVTAGPSWRTSRTSRCRFAVGRALLELGDVELDAGGELVGYAVRYADFQIGFLRDLVSELPPVLSAGPVGQQATAKFCAGLRAC